MSEGRAWWGAWNLLVSVHRAQFFSNLWLATRTNATRCASFLLRARGKVFTCTPLAVLPSRKGRTMPQTTPGPQQVLWVSLASGLNS